MKSLFSKYVWLRLILSILLLFAGTLIVIFAASKKQNILQEGLDIITATILFLSRLSSIILSAESAEDNEFSFEVSVG